MSDTIRRIDFRENSKNIPSRITKTFQRNSTDFFRLNNQIIEEYGRMRWEELRQEGHDLRLHTIEHLAEYLEMLETKVIENGGHVHWARNSEEARRIVVKIAQDKDVKKIVKVKSMTSEEINLNTDLIQAGFSVVETDLGEFIVQIAGQKPSHITAPALHMTKEEIAELFNAKLGVQIEADPVQMSQVAASRLRQDFLSADMGISSANFLVAETGTLVIVTNEGNGRLCTTLPPLHVAVVGIEKVVPDWQSLAIVLSLLPRNATAQKMTSYVSLISGVNPIPGEGPGEFHLVLLDNGRSKILADPELRKTLLCIRCGACLDACPIYSTVGGHAYGSTYPGPIGAILTPQLLGLEAAGGLAFASTLCGACNDVCAVKIPITSLLLRLRQQVVDQRTDGYLSQQASLRRGAGWMGTALGSPGLYAFGMQALKLLQAPFRRGDWLPRLPGPMGRWTSSRPLPAFKANFRRWWRRRNKK